MKKLTEDQYNEIINHELAYCGLTIKDVINKPDWYSENTMTTDQASEWKDWTIKYLMKTCKVSKKIAEREFSWINLEHGLGISDEDK